MAQDNVATAHARERFAAEMGALGTEELARAFAAVRREDFLPPAPWTIHGAGGSRTTSDAAQLYQDALVAIDAKLGVNNGQPSLHAAWLAALAPRLGEAVVHVGCGGGYYTAILAELVGAGGRVYAYEVVPHVAALARAALADRANVEVRETSGAAGDLPPADVIYVNAAAQAPARAWIEALREGGRLIFPWAHGGGGEAALLIRREGARFPARMVDWVRFIPLAGDQPRAGASAYPERVAQVAELVLSDERAPDASLVADFGWAWFSAG